MRRNLIADEKEGRKEALQGAIDDFAEAVANGGGQQLLDRVMGMFSHVHSYSFNNLLLQAIQAPDSRLVASMKAFEEIAEEQEHESVKMGRFKNRVRRAKGAKAVWILLPIFRDVEEEDERTGEIREVNKLVGYKYVSTWAAEEIVYADTGEPFEVPDYRTPIEDRPLYDALCAFAEAKGIEIEHVKLFGGVKGVSKGGEINLDERDHWAVTLRTLAHEIGHELIHPDKEDPNRPDRKIREVEAETFAVAVMRYFGHEDSETSEAYLRSYGATKREILASLRRVMKAANEAVKFIAEGHLPQAKDDGDGTGTPDAEAA